MTALFLVLLAVPTVAQDIRGLEICTAEKDMARRTSCLQSNVELLQQELTKQARRAQDERATATKELTAMKGDLAAFKSALDKTQAELAELKKPKPVPPPSSPGPREAR